MHSDKLNQLNESHKILPAIRTIVDMHLFGIKVKKGGGGGGGGAGRQGVLSAPVILH